ncbi:MAG TPA: M17 family peptidase N-terminal domain-containing protein, partial [bacterium]|nr:M17 family peptidase N-terminal domain-containing protein [bacterium]
MKIKSEAKDVAAYKGDVLIVNLFEGVAKPGGATGAIDAALGGAVSKLIKRGEFKGRKEETAVLPGGGKIGAERVVLVGLGKKEAFGADAARLAASVSINKAKAMKAVRIGTVAHGAGAGGLSPEQSGRAIAEGAILGGYGFDKYISTKKGKDGDAVEVTILIKEKADAIAAGRGSRTGVIMAESANLARDMVNEPPNVLTPGELAARAKSISRSS